MSSMHIIYGDHATFVDENKTYNVIEMSTQNT